MMKGARASVFLAALHALMLAAAAITRAPVDVVANASAIVAWLFVAGFECGALTRPR